MLRLFLSVCALFVCTLTLHAQTAGALAPEVTKFTPLDSTQLVNQTTGDFNYTLPIMSIPGAPGGAWPLTAAYGSGISFKTEASWIGLGWNLSLGQVTRTVRGYADDFNGISPRQHEDGKWFGKFRDEITAIYRTAGIQLENVEPFDPWANWTRQTVSDYEVELGGPAIFAGIKSIKAVNTRTAYVPGAVSLEPTILQSASPALQGAPTSDSKIFGYIYMSQASNLLDNSGLGDPLDRVVSNDDLIFDVSSIDYEGSLFSFMRTDNDPDDSNTYERNFNDAAAISADHVTANVDRYYLAAEGISGFVRPIQQKRGWLYPSFRLFENNDNKDQRLFPYAQAANTLDGLDVTGPDQDDLFNNRDQGWAAQAADEDNMVFQFDPGMLQKTRLFSSNDGTDESGEVFHGEGADIANTAKSIRYETDSDGRIIRMIAVREDGTRYIFGHHRAITYNKGGIDRVLGYRYGAAPRIMQTDQISEVRDTFSYVCTEPCDDPCATGPCVVDCPPPEDRRTQTTTAHYSYAWNLAAVESADYVDDGDGIYDPDDQGDYIAFVYGVYASDYWYQSPWSDNDNQATFFYTGRDSIDSTFYNFTREKGAKELVYAKRAETRTHVALFDLSNRQDAQPVKHLGDKASVLDDWNMYRRGDIYPGYSGPDAEYFVTYGDEHLDMRVNGQEGKDEVPTVVPYSVLKRNDMHVEGQTYTDAVIANINVNSGVPSSEFNDAGPVNDGVVHSLYDMRVLKVYPERDKALILIEDVRNPHAHPQPEPWHHSKTPINYFRFNDKCNNYIDRGMMKLDGIRLYARNYYEANKAVLDEVEAKVSSNDLDTWHRYLSRVNFEFAGQDLLTPGKPNSDAPDSGSLTLSAISSQTFGGVSTGNNYSFDYYTYTPPTTELEYFNNDGWGLYSKVSTHLVSKVDPDYLEYNASLGEWVVDDNVGDAVDRVPIQAAWSLRSITTPTGSKIKVDYERDRYAYVQDRLAVDVDAVKGQVPGVTGLLKTTLITPGQVTGSTFTTMDVLRRVNLDTTNKWDQHVLVDVTYKLGNTNYNRPFVLSVRDGDFFRADAALEELASWLILVEKTLSISDSGSQTTDLVAVDYYTIPLVNQMPDTNYCVLEAGSLRVKALTMSEARDVNGTGDSYRLEYFYTELPQTATTDLAGGFASGVVFNQPAPTIGNDLFNDQRLVRPNESAARSLENIEVMYASSTLRYVGNNGQAEALENRTYFTAKDQVVNNPFYRDWPQATNIDADTFGVESTDLGGTNFVPTQSMSLPIYDGSNTATGGQPQSASLVMERDARKIIVNNAALVGQPKAIRVLDADTFNELTSQNMSYGASFVPGSVDPRLNGSSDFKLKSWSLNNNSLTEAHNPGKDSDRLYSQGVFVDKSMYLGLRGIRNSGAYSLFKSGILLTDEITNTFRPSINSATETHYLAGGVARTTEVANESLAWDYKTGVQSIARIVGAADNSARFAYSLNVPAHGLYNDPVLHTSGGPSPVDYNMTALNMVTQPGLVLTAVSSYDLDVDNFVNSLASSAGSGQYHHVISANFTHWRRPAIAQSGLDVPSNFAWVPDTEFGYYHSDNSKTSNGWRSLDLQQGSTVSLDVSPGSGTWRAAGQNTLYDARLNVLEFRDRRDVYSSLRLVEQRDVRLPAASFANARWDQVYYDGFETNPVAYDTLNEGDLSTVSSFTGEYTSVYAGNGSRQLSGGYTSGSLPSLSASWLSFYTNAAEDTSFTINGQTLPITNTQDHLQGIYITPVDNDWFHVKIKYTSPLAAILISSAVTGNRIDELTYYPAQGSGSGDAEPTVSLAGFHPIWLTTNSTTDPRGRTVRYEFNKRGELFRVYDIYGDLLREHFSAQPGERLAPADAFDD